MKGEQYGMGKLPSYAPTHPILFTFMALKDELFSFGNCTQALFEETKIGSSGAECIGQYRCTLPLPGVQGSQLSPLLCHRGQSLHQHPSTSPAILQAETRQPSTLTWFFSIVHRQRG